MQRIRPFLRSFSFRAGALIFFALSATLLTLRILIYTQSINTAYDDIRHIIDAHVDEISEGIEHYGIKYSKDVVEGIIEDSHDKHLYLALKHGNVIVGNLQTWPAKEPKPMVFSPIRILRPGNLPTLYLLVKKINYRRNVTLLVGYDLKRVQLLHDTLFRALVGNLILAFILSLVFSLLIVWLLNHHFRRFNIACDRIMTGNLDYRLHTYQSGDEFDKLAANINRMLDWNKALISTVNDSTNAIAHDMRTPLSRLRLELRALSERPELGKDIRTQIFKQVERVDTLIEMFENILNIARAEARSSTELFEMVDLGQLVQDVLDFYEPIIEEKRLSLQADIPDEAIIIKGDKQLLSQAVVNLVDNACKYTLEGGTISVQLQKLRDNVTLTVTDNGSGIPQELLEKAKERYFRVDESRHSKGYGLGLSLVNAVAALHRGTLTLENSHPGLKAVLILGR